MSWFLVLVSLFASTFCHHFVVCNILFIICTLYILLDETLYWEHHHPFPSYPTLLPTTETAGTCPSTTSSFNNNAYVAPLTSQPPSSSLTTSADRVRAWAHSAAHQNKFNPWSQSDQDSKAAGKAPADGQETEVEKPKGSRSTRLWKNVKAPLFHSWVNVLLVFVPVGIAVHFANINPNIVFALNAVAIIPLAGLLTFATECVAHRLGPTLGALLNVSFGNAVELIIFIIALVKNEIRIVQASLIGSLLANLLLILGMAFLIGGLEFQEQIYDSTVTQMSACLLALAVLSLLIPVRRQQDAFKGRTAS